MMLPSANELQYFLELCQTLNFSRASERLGISQPSLSVAIQVLEKKLATKLFVRSKTGVLLTPSGKKLLNHAKQLQHLWINLKNDIHFSHHEVQGSVSLGCHPSLSIFALKKFLPALVQQYPKLEIQLKHDLSRRILEDIIKMTIDVGILVNPISHPDLVIKKLYEDRVTFWNNPKFYLKQKTESNILICDPELAQTQWLLKKIHKNKNHYHRLITSSNLETIASLAANGAGTAILPESVIVSQNCSVLKPVKHLPVYCDDICLVYRSENKENKAIKTLIDAVKINLNNLKLPSLFH